MVAAEGAATPPTTILTVPCTEPYCFTVSGTTSWRLAG